MGPPRMFAAQAADGEVGARHPAPWEQPVAQSFVQREFPPRRQVNRVGSSVAEW